MMNVYCHADAAEQATWFGDDIGFKGDGFETLDMSTAQTIAFLLRRVGSHGSGVDAGEAAGGVPGRGHEAGGRLPDDALDARARSSPSGSAWPTTVCVAIRQAYEQWDGKGYPRAPARRRRSACRRGWCSSPPRSRSSAAAAASRRRWRWPAGTAARSSTRRWSTCSATTRRELLDGLDEASDWDAVLDAEPQLSRRVGGSELDEVLEAMADLVDLKSPVPGRPLARRGQPGRRGGARLWAAGDEDVDTLRRAGLIHDLGRLGVSNAIWDKAGPLTEAERERVRLHPYLTDRMLARVPALGPRAARSPRATTSGWTARAIRAV